ncbi:proprotein convertase P-domain-containing protein [Solirubrobacter ginsenosidimutans]|uniref:Proprotein convertase P-domain-containing protein n=1 Tax=Solirubrobacter ginsenosidimutans TaxID=490573 RepID=A0A9X3MMB4_9ACTN|nr:proprotein convertase P-domain-containing protein [Solirubrobacter ginsenosidimutans]MDA0158740.1 proprotein convertase P-domain-containing protein [Solirubrobacter ginsenosidimutans]
MGRLTTVRRIGTLVAATLAVAPPAQADDQWAFTEFPTSSESGAAAVAVQPDGKFVLAGAARTYDDDLGIYLSRVALARYNPDLSLDRSFSDDGQQTTEVDADQSAGVADMTLQADGKIVVAGVTGRSPATDFLLARYRADGSLDTTFGTGGISTIDLGASEWLGAVALQRDGKIVVAGVHELPDWHWESVIARYRSDGSLDTSFGGDGMVTFADDISQSLAIQADGRLVLAGRDRLVRFRPDGSLDGSFGTGGVVQDSWQYIEALALQADGRIVTAGSNGQIALSRYLANGSLDWSFGNGGRQTVDMGPYGGGANDVAIRGDGTILAVGQQDWSDWLSGMYGTNLLLAPVDPDGSPAASFEWSTVPSSQLQAATAVAPGPESDFVIAGWGDASIGNPRFLVGRLDGRPPMITDGPTGHTSDTAPAFTFTPAVPGSALACRLDGPGATTGSFDACTSPKTYSALADGDYTFTVRATDPAGNVTRSTRLFTVEAIPNTTITSGPSGPTNETVESFWFTASTAGATFQCKLDRPSGLGSYAACSEPVRYSSLPDGAYTFSVRAIGPHGADPTPAMRSFTVDTVAPQTTITGGPSGNVSGTSQTFTFTSSEEGSSFHCRLTGPAGETPAWCTSPWVGPTPTNGSYTLTVTAWDAAGNRDATPATRTFTVSGQTPPDTTITGGPDGPTNQRGPSFAFTATVPGSTFECQLQEPTTLQVYRPCSSPQAYVLHSDGTYTFYVRASHSGSTDATPATRTFTVDTVAPETTINSGPSGTVSGASQSFAFGSSEAGSTFECKLDTPSDVGAYATCLSPRTYATTVNGAYTFAVRATDAAGNTDATPTTRSFTIATVPDTTITGGPSGLTNGTAPSFSFTTTVAGSTFECKLDTPSGAGSYTACSSPRAYATTANGAYTFSVRAVGPGGTDPTPATRSFRVDTVAPTTSLDSGPVGSTTDDTPTFTFSSNEPGSFECRLDTVETPGFFEPCASPLTLGPLAGGVEYALFVRAIDAAGNPDPGFAHSGLFVVDGSPPDTWIDSGPTGVTSDTGPSFTFHATLGGSTFECKLDRPGGAGSYAACSSPQGYTTTADGPYTLTVRATSNGRTDPSPATRSFTVTTTPNPTPTSTPTPSPTPTASPTPTPSPTSTPSPSPSPSPAGCGATNGSDVQIGDLSTVESPITVSGCAGNASATATVEVHIVHTYIGDLVVSLIAPDGSTYLLHNRAGGSADNIDQTYTVNLSSEPANGTWKLRVQDAAAADVGRVDSWTVNLGASPTPTPSPAGCGATNGSHVQIGDLTTVESPITVSGCAGNASATATVEVHIVHTYIGDLVVSLIAPDGSTYLLHNRAGGSADNIDQTYTVNLSSEPANGTWKLRVQDAAAADVGRVDSWTIRM